MKTYPTTQWMMTRGDFLRLTLAAPLLLSAPFAFCADKVSETMMTRPIPSTKEALPVIGCGTSRVFDVGDDAARRAQLVEVLRVLFAAGGSVIDTSPMYGSAERVVGDLLASMKDHEKAFIATKVWTTGRQEGIDQMEESMRLLRDERIDLMQIHNLVDWRTQLATLRRWKSEGRIRYLGITHYTDSAHDKLEEVMRAETFDFVQINYAVDDRGVESRLLPLAQERGIAIMVNRPFGGGGLLRRLGNEPPPGWAADIGCTNWAQVLLKFVLSHPAVTCIIPGTSKPDHMRDNVRAGFGALPDAALRKKIIEAVTK